MKKRTIIYIVLLIIILLVVSALMKSQPSIDEQISVTCVKNGGSFNESTKVCTLAPKAPAATTQTQQYTFVQPKSSATPAPQPAVRTYQLHVINSGKTVYYSSTTVQDMLQVTNPPTDTNISAPITLTGLARGPWYFEATAPVIITDVRGKILGETTVVAQSNWMTKEFVPFLGTLDFPAQPTGSTGVVIFKNSNPSGDPKKDMSIEILVKFK